MYYNIAFNKCILLCLIILSFSCSSAQVESKSENSEQMVDTELAETDAFVALVDKHLDTLYLVEEPTTGNGYNERGRGYIAMYFQGNYVIKMVENIEVEKSHYDESYYLYDVKPIFLNQKITHPNGSLEINKIYFKDWKITHWFQNGILIIDPSKVKAKNDEITANFNRFK